MPIIMKSKQLSSHLLMIRPASFGFNQETALDNTFQVSTAENKKNIQENALKEFNAFVQLLQSYKIDVTVIDDAKAAQTTDAVFPNNWISFHENGTVCLYPMMSLVRRRERERRQHILEILKQRFSISKIVDLTTFEDQDKFLEGTGSLIFDHDFQLSYLCLSKRTDLDVFQAFCTEIGSYTKDSATIFKAVDKSGLPIYHTNVIMCVGENFVIICLEAIHDDNEKHNVVTNIQSTGKELVEISMEQMYNFAGNMLQICNEEGERFLVMSSRAFNSLSLRQISKLESFDQKLVHTDLTTIENNGGGSARCMIAEIFLPVLHK